MTAKSSLTGCQQPYASISTIAAPRVSFQGELGAYGDEAIIQQWHGQATAVPSVSFEHVITDVATGFTDFGVVPVWNSIVGEIKAGVAAIQIGKQTPFTIRVIGDIHVLVKHQLLGLQGSVSDDIRSVASRPVALAQCTGFLRNHPLIETIPSYDTAGAARQLATSGSPTASAIASRHAAKRYGLSILQKDVQDVPDNVTQFLVVTRTSDPIVAARPRVMSTGNVRW